MTLSIITINYNNRDGLKRTIDSVVAQTFTDYEWIVIDGGSTDGSRELIEQYADHFAFWCSEPDNGIYNAMNKGITHSHGDWLLFLNSGDWLYEANTLERVSANDSQADVLYGDVLYHWPDKRGKELDIKPDKLSLYYFYEHTLCHQASFYKRSIFDSHLYDENYRICSDWALFIQLVVDGYHFEHLPFCVVNFPQDGISSKLTEAHVAERRAVYEKLIPCHLKNDMEELRRHELYDKHINSHKSYRRIMSHAEKRIKRTEKIILWIEKMKKNLGLCK